jgi:hypothetical protein
MSTPNESEREGVKQWNAAVRAAVGRRSGTGPALPPPSAAAQTMNHLIRQAAGRPVDEVADPPA